MPGGSATAVLLTSTNVSGWLAGSPRYSAISRRHSGQASFYSTVSVLRGQEAGLGIDGTLVITQIVPAEREPCGSRVFTPATRPPACKLARHRADSPLCRAAIPQTTFANSVT